MTAFVAPTCPAWLNPDAVAADPALVAQLAELNAELEPLVRQLIALNDRRYSLVEQVWAGWHDDLPADATGYGEEITGIAYSSGLLHLLGVLIFERMGGGIFPDQIPPLLERYGIQSSVEVNT